MEKTKDVFLFWIGDPEKISKLVNDIKANGLNPVVGPSKEEHDYLYENYAFYRKSYDMKIWSYCSDVWRFYILSKYNGLYIDTSVEIGKEFKEFYDTASKNNYYFVKQRKSILASAIIGSFEKGELFLEMLNTFKFFDQHNPHAYFIAPYIVTNIVSRKIYYSVDWKPFIKDGIFIDILPSIRDKKTIFKLGTGSWVIDQKANYLKKNHIDKFRELEKDWKNKKLPHGAKMKLKYSNVDIFSPDIFNIRKLYENHMISLQTSKLLISNIKYNVKFIDKFIWSRTYLLFRRKYV